MPTTPQLSLMARKNLLRMLCDLELFSTTSGLKLNNKKTEALWIGSYTGRADQLCPEKNLKWIKDKTKSLGVWINKPNNQYK